MTQTKEERRENKRKYTEAHKNEKKEYDRNRRIIHREEILRAKKEYYRTHREVCNIASKKYYENHRDKIKKDNKKYKETHHNERVISSHKYYEIHKDKISEWCKEYRKNNPEIDNAHQRKRKAKKLASLGRGINAKQEIELFELYNHVCSYCGKKKKLEIDHIEPLNRGGADDIENVTTACKSCNCSKSDKTLLRFLYDRLQRG